MVVLVPTVVVGQIMYEFLWVPVRAMQEEHPEVGIHTARFWRIFLLEGGYGYHVKDATPRVLGWTCAAGPPTPLKGCQRSAATG